MGCNCGSGAKSRQVSTTSSGKPYTAESVAWRHFADTDSEAAATTASAAGRSYPDGVGYSDYPSPEAAAEAKNVLAGGGVRKVDPTSGRFLD